MPKNYTKKNIEKGVFAEYYSNKGLETFIEDMENVFKTSKGLNDLEEKSKQLKSKTPYRDLQEITQKGIEYMLKLPIGEKAISILTRAADNIAQRKKFHESYKNTVLVLEGLVQNYKELSEKVIIYELSQENSLY